MKNYSEEIKKMSVEDLENNLITQDFRGPEFKKQALEEIIQRKTQIIADRIDNLKATLQSIIDLPLDIFTEEGLKEMCRNSIKQQE